MWHCVCDLQHEVLIANRRTPNYCKVLAVIHFIKIKIVCYDFISLIIAISVVFTANCLTLNHMYSQFNNFNLNDTLDSYASS